MVRGGDRRIRRDDCLAGLMSCPSIVEKLRNDVAASELWFGGEQMSRIRNLTYCPD
jgi:hypothetical protein